MTEFDRQFSAHVIRLEQTQMNLDIQDAYEEYCRVMLNAKQSGDEIAAVRAFDKYEAITLQKQIDFARLLASVKVNM